MLDLRLRTTKERLTRRPAKIIGRHISANQLTALGLAITLGAAVAAAADQMLLGLGLWLISRIADGLDGPVARVRQEVSEFGGYTDLVADTVGYTAVPLGVAYGVGTSAAWTAVAFLLGAFYLNSVSWLYLSAVLEKPVSYTHLTLPTIYSV